MSVHASCSKHQPVLQCLHCSICGHLWCCLAPSVHCPQSRLLLSRPYSNQRHVGVQRLHIGLRPRSESQRRKWRKLAETAPSPAMSEMTPVYAVCKVWGNGSPKAVPQTLRLSKRRITGVGERNRVLHSPPLRRRRVGSNRTVCGRWVGWWCIGWKSSLITFPSWEIIQSQSGTSSKGSHCKCSVLISEQTVVPKGGVCQGKQTENNFVSGSVPPPQKRGFSQPPQQEWVKLLFSADLREPIWNPAPRDRRSPACREGSAPQKGTCLLKGQNPLPPPQLPFGPVASLARLGNGMEIAPCPLSSPMSVSRQPVSQRAREAHTQPDSFAGQRFPGCPRPSLCSVPVW